MDLLADLLEDPPLLLFSFFFFSKQNHRGSFHSKETQENTTPPLLSLHVCRLSRSRTKHSLIRPCNTWIDKIDTQWPAIQCRNLVVRIMFYHLQVYLVPTAQFARHQQTALQCSHGLAIICYATQDTVVYASCDEQNLARANTTLSLCATNNKLAMPNSGWNEAPPIRPKGVLGMWPMELGD